MSKHRFLLGYTFFDHDRDPETNVSCNHCKWGQPEVCGCCGVRTHETWTVSSSPGRWTDAEAGPLRSVAAAEIFMEDRSDWKNNYLYVPWMEASQSKFAWV